MNKYYQKLRKEARERQQNLSEEEKDKNAEKGPERHQNPTEEEREKRHQYHQKCKQKLPDYRRNYYLKHKT